MNNKLTSAAVLLALVGSALVGCGGSSSTTTTTGTGTTSQDGSTSTPGFAGTYNATFTGTYQNTSPNTLSGTSSTSATITVTNVSGSEVELAWQVPPSPPSGTAYFAMSGSSGTLLDAGSPVSVVEAGSGVGVGGSCFSGTVNGNAQTNCCTSCTVSFDGTTMTQPNSGVYTGTTPAGVAYTGTYSGTWTGTRQ